VAYAIRQISFFLLALWVVITLSFFLRQMVGLQPFTAPEFLPGHSTHSAPLLTLYLNYLGHVLRLNFGQSLATPFGSVNALVGRSLPWTLGLVGIGTVLSLLLGTALGIILAWHRGSLLDTVLTPAAVFASSIPYYFVAMILVYVAGLNLGWFPVGDPYNPDLTPQWSDTFIADVIRHGVLPLFAVVVATFGLWVIPMRNAMVGVLDDDFMALGRAKGLRARRLMLGYAARNVLLPIATNFAIQFGYILGGAVFVEVVFNYPGLGWLLVQSVYDHDYPTVQALVILVAALGLLAHLAARLLYPWLDPRTRRG